MSKQTPPNAEHGREATEKDLLYLQARGLPDHALAADIKLYQVKKEGLNLGKWCWTWGKSFLGFHGQFPKAEETGSLFHRFNKGKIIPFPTEENDEKKLGYDRLDVASVIRKRQLRLAAAETNEENDYLTPASTPKATKPPSLKRTNTMAFPPLEDAEKVPAQEPKRHKTE
jgi:hypothetical protein